MRFITIYRTKDVSEISGIKDILIREKIEYKILSNDDDPDAENAKLTGTESRIQVQEDQRERAEALLDEHGYTPGEHIASMHKSTVPDPRVKPMIGKWVIFLLVALVILIVIILFFWFMVPE